MANGSLVRMGEAFGAAAHGCNPGPDGLANDPVARMFGCPDCPGMPAIAGTFKHTFCFWIKRPIGQLALAAGVGTLLYFLLKGE